MDYSLNQPQARPDTFPEDTPDLDFATQFHSSIFAAANTSNMHVTGADPTLSQQHSDVPREYPASTSSNFVWAIPSIFPAQYGPFPTMPSEFMDGTDAYGIQSEVAENNRGLVGVHTSMAVANVGHERGPATLNNSRIIDAFDVPWIGRSVQVAEPLLPTSVMNRLGFGLIGSEVSIPTNPSPANMFASPPSQHWFAQDIPNSLTTCRRTESFMDPQPTKAINGSSGSFEASLSVAGSKPTRVEAAKRNRHPRDEWGEMEKHIRRLYIEANHTAKEVHFELCAIHGFQTS